LLPVVNGNYEFSRCRAAFSFGAGYGMMASYLHRAGPERKRNKENGHERWICACGGGNAEN